MAIGRSVIRQRSLEPLLRMAAFRVPVPMAPASAFGFTSPWLASARPRAHIAAVSRLRLQPAVR